MVQTHTSQVAPVFSVAIVHVTTIYCLVVNHGTITSLQVSYTLCHPHHGDNFPTTVQHQPPTGGAHQPWLERPGGTLQARPSVAYATSLVKRSTTHHRGMGAQWLLPSAKRDHTSSQVK
jgi:hypothetical protein